MSKIKLCIVIPNHWTHVMGGAQYQVKLITEALINHEGFEIYLVTNRAKLDSAENAGYQLVTLGSRNGWRRFTYLPDGPELLQALRQIKPDVIYHRVSCAYTGVCGYYARESGCQFVWHIAHEWDVSPFDWKFNKLLPFRLVEKKAAEYGIRRTNLVFAQTKVQQQLLQQHFGKPAVLVPNFHPPATETVVKRQVFTVLWVANLKAWKRPDAFVRLAKAFNQRDDVEFVMIGRAMFAQSGYQQLQQDIESARNLTYLGEQPLAAVNQWLAQSHVFVNTSLYEGFPNTFIQAWMRRSVVVSLGVDPDQTLSETTPKIGFCAKNDEQELRAIIERLLENQAFGNEVAQNGADYAAANHSLMNVEKVVTTLAGLGSSSLAPMVE